MKGGFLRPRIYGAPGLTSTVLSDAVGDDVGQFRIKGVLWGVVIKLCGTFFSLLRDRRRKY